ncbi:hypothetical protein CBR_g40822 [Chara braunii]|uniref:Integrase catalytic domain-containing protein n=1 Tax=Chara braunii TaxID=69332 RepID=A0A388LUT0_CHABU|nr:hypothetical protein CBR_g40822 [Chara braunii]|eukprot:GBG86009.1 hypothetical protein CBR_g40822 [Chara braunii]
MASEEEAGNLRSKGSQGTERGVERNEGSIRDRESANPKGTKEDGKDLSTVESSGKAGGSKRGSQENKEGRDKERSSPRNSDEIIVKKAKLSDARRKLAEIEKRTAEYKARLIEEMMAENERDLLGEELREERRTRQGEIRHGGKHSSHRGMPSKKGKEKGDSLVVEAEKATNPPAIDSGVSRLPAAPKIMKGCDRLWGLRERVLGWFDPEGTTTTGEKRKDSKEGEGTSTAGEIGSFEGGLKKIISTLTRALNKNQGYLADAKKKLTFDGVNITEFLIDYEDLAALLKWSVEERMNHLGQHVSLSLGRDIMAIVTASGSWKETRNEMMWKYLKAEKMATEAELAAVQMKNYATYNDFLRLFTLVALRILGVTDRIMSKYFLRQFSEFDKDKILSAYQQTSKFEHVRDVDFSTVIDLAEKTVVTETLALLKEGEVIDLTGKTEDKVKRGIESLHERVHGVDNKIERVENALLRCSRSLKGKIFGPQGERINWNSPSGMRRAVIILNNMYIAAVEAEPVADIVWDQPRGRGAQVNFILEGNGQDRVNITTRRVGEEKKLIRDTIMEEVAGTSANQGEPETGKPEKVYGKTREEELIDKATATKKKFRYQIPILTIPEIDDTLSKFLGDLEDLEKAFADIRLSLPDREGGEVMRAPPGTKLSLHTLPVGKLKVQIRTHHTDALVDGGAEDFATITGCTVNKVVTGSIRGAGGEIPFAGYVTKYAVKAGIKESIWSFQRMTVMEEMDHDIILGRPWCANIEMIGMHLHDGTYMVDIKDPVTVRGELLRLLGTGGDPPKGKLATWSPTFEDSARKGAFARMEEGSVQKYKPVGKKAKPVSILVETLKEETMEKEEEILRIIRERRAAKGHRIPDEVANTMKIGVDGFLTTKKTQLIRKVCQEFHLAFAFNDHQKGRLDAKLISPVRIHTVEHECWNDKESAYEFGIAADITELLRAKIDSFVAEPTASPYANKWFVFRKPNKTLRWIQDLQKLNAVTIRDEGSLPQVDLQAESYIGRSIYSLINLYSGYDQVSLDARDRPYNAMHTPVEQLQMQVTPMDFTNVVAEAQRRMLAVVGDMFPEKCEPYIDDNPIKGAHNKDETEVQPRVQKFIWDHLQDIKDQWFLVYNITASRPKSILVVPELTILGFRWALKNYKPIDPTVGRWIGFIWQFDYKVERIVGLRNRADGLSRVCITPEGIEDAEPIDAFLEYEGGTLVADNEMTSLTCTPGQLLIQTLEKGAPVVVTELREGPITTTRRKDEKDSWGATLGPKEELMAMVVEGGRNAVMCLVESWTQKKLWYLVSQAQEKRETNQEGQSFFLAQMYDDIFREIGLLLIGNKQPMEVSPKAREEAEKYVMRNGHLFKKEEGMTPRRVVCGRSKQLDVIQGMHDGLAGGHQLSKPTLAKIAPLYFWPGMTGMVATYCQTCLICQEGSSARIFEPLRPTRVLGPGHLVHLDLAVMPVSIDGYMYILDARDNLNGYVEAVALKRKMGKGVADWIKDFYLRHPFVRKFIADNGTEFVNQEVLGKLKMLCVPIKIIERYHHEANEPVERGHRNLKNTIAKLAADDLGNWPRYLKEAVFSENMTPKRTTRCIRAELWYEMEIDFPVEALVPIWNRLDDNPHMSTEKLIAAQCQ